MANIQELMQMVKQAPAEGRARVRFTITPHGSSTTYSKTICTSRPLGEVRERVRQMALRRWSRFTFTVRAL